MFHMMNICREFYVVLKEDNVYCSIRICENNGQGFCLRKIFVDLVITFQINKYTYISTHTRLRNNLDYIGNTFRRYNDFLMLHLMQTGTVSVNIKTVIQ